MSGQLIPPRRHRGPIYLYLARPEWAKTWIEGGAVPLQPASTYLSQERSGTGTPDELRQLLCDGGDAGIISQFFGGLRNATIEGCTFVNFDANNPQSTYTVDRVTYSHFIEDALIFCAACSASADLQRRLGKQVCVRIDDVEALKACLDEQLGTRSDAGRVSYTEGSERAHFLKSTADAWQDEFRFSWAIRPVEPRTVTIPAGTAKLVSLR